MKDKTYHAAGGVVMREPASSEVEILLLDRSSRNEVRLPKGHVDAGESVREAALRETTEEAGYTDLDIIADLGAEVVEFDYKGEHYVRHEHYFLMRLRSNHQIPRNDHDAKQFAVRWLPLTAAADALTYKAEQRRVQQAMMALERLHQGS